MQHPTLRRLCVAAPLTAALGLAACGGGSDSGGTGSLTLDVTDAKIDAALAVNVVFTGIVLQPQDGERIELGCGDPEFACDDTLDPPARTIDLLDYTGDASTILLEDLELPAGRYEWIRLLVDAASPPDPTGGRSSIVLETNPDGSEPLVIPSGGQSGLKLVQGFDVPAGGSASFTIDFDLRKAITLTGNGRYMLRPALRLVDNSNAGHLVGEIANAFAQAECGEDWTFSDGGALIDGLAVYLYPGAGATVGDLGGEDAPLTTDMARMDENGDFDYAIGFVEAGPYTAAVVCNPTADAEDTGADELQVAATVDVTIEAAPPPTVLDFE